MNLSSLHNSVLLCCFCFDYNYLFRRENEMREREKFISYKYINRKFQQKCLRLL